jgi:hypothetical protein
MPGGIDSRLNVAENLRFTKKRVRSSIVTRPIVAEASRINETRPGIVETSCINDVQPSVVKPSRFNGNAAV